MRTHRNRRICGTDHRRRSVQRRHAAETKTIDPSTGTTVYEFWFSPQTLGVAKLKKDLYFGLGVAVVDSDPDAPGLTGWAGWGPESVLFEAKPSEAAAVILTGDPDEGDE